MEAQTQKNAPKIWLYQKKFVPLHPQFNDGAIAQLVEHRTENPCVTGSNPVGTTQKTRQLRQFVAAFFFVFANLLRTQRTAKALFLT